MEAHAFKTWTHSNGTFWPRDLLPAHVPYARILLFAYNSNVAFDSSAATLSDHADNLLERYRAIKARCSYIIELSPVAEVQGSPMEMRSQPYSCLTASEDYWSSRYGVGSRPQPLFKVEYSLISPKTLGINQSAKQ